MNDALLSASDQKEALSRVYVRVVAARAGYVTTDRDFDRDGVDLGIEAGGNMRPKLDVQMKATENLGAPKGEHFHFPLKAGNYDKLRIDTQTPRILVVLDLPKDSSRWMTVTEESLVLRRRAFWLNLRGCDEKSNQSSVTVQIPRGNLFNVDSLHRLMQQSRNGRIQ